MLHVRLPHPVPPAVQPGPLFSSAPPKPADRSHCPRPRPQDGIDVPSHARAARCGLATPPSDMTGSTGGVLVSQRALAAGLRTGDMPTMQKRYAGFSGPTAHASSMFNAVSHRGVGPHSKPPSPASQPSSVRAGDGVHQRKSSANAIAPSLKIPVSIDTPQESIAQLAAEITCLFWFESSATLNQVVEAKSPLLPARAIVPEAVPQTSFRKWVTTILTTTQVVQNVVLLALLFIYRLKKINPEVKGKPGSEYRLLTVALMLGNKFLDDNTYTNKTWAEVSGISVQEVHIMEVEFLSNMKYDLFTSSADWMDWHATLGRFGTFFDAASRLPQEAPPRALGPITPTYQKPPVFPSPPISNHASPPFLGNLSPNHSIFSNTPVLLPQITSASVSPIGLTPVDPQRPRNERSLPDIDRRIAAGRKRTYDEQSQEPVPKRVARSYPHHHVPVSNAAAQALPRLSLPSLSIPPSQSVQAPVQLAPQLPPPAGRSMALIYPPATQWSQPPAMASTAPPSMPPAPQVIPNGHLGDLSRQLSPFPCGSAGSSPISASFPVQNPNRLSPSFYLSQRNSPYRPVRGVHTLLVPPPPTSMQGPPRHFTAEQMQYQPLGRMTERRVGPVPYMTYDAWPETNQFNQWPVLPTPNFHR